MYKYLIITALCMFSVLQLFAQPGETRDRPLVVTTTAQIADMIENIAGQHVEVRHLMGSGVDPHLYRPTRSDVLRLKQADIVFYNGLHLEGQMIELLEKLGAEKPVIGLGDHLQAAKIIRMEDNVYDPHIWMNVKIWAEAVDVAESAISKFNPTHRDSYQQKAEHYKEKLVILDQHIETLISTIPESAQILLTAHDAFGYFEQGYGIEVIGIQGLSTESEAGLKRVEELVDILVEKKVPAIFAETSVSERNIKALIEGAKARGHDVKLGGFLYSDAMGAKGSPEGTYIGMMDFNVRTITKALGGEISALLPDRVFASAL